MENGNQLIEERRNGLPDNAHIRDLLRRRAKERGNSFKWNANTLIFAYTILATTIILSIRSINIAIVAIVAVIGLVLIWIFSYQQARKMENEFLKDELKIYMDLLTNQSREHSELETVNQVPVKQNESPLTERELQVLRLLGEGRSNKDTASTLHISDQTVKNHISHIFAKLGVNDRTSAVLFALSQGWIKNDDIEHSRSILDNNR
jgi:DNA-binding CsgD family transcriptional regulator